MREILIIVIILISSGAQSQNCVDLKKKAISDAQSGIYKYLVGHANSANSVKFNFYYLNYLKTNYGIQREEYMLGSPIVDSCYWETMDSIFNIKFGSDFLKKEFTKVSDSYSKLSNKQKSKVLIQDTLYHMVFVDKVADFLGNDIDIQNYFKKTYSIKDSTFKDWVNVFFIGYQDSIIGYELDIHSNKKLPISSQQRKRDVIELNKLGKSKSAKLWGIKVTSDVFF